MDAQALLEQAPDGQVASSATRLAGSSGWQGTGRSDTALWGLCKGSGKNPYQVCVDLGDRATKCSCPSRKFPCKHALALQLRDAREPLPVAETPDWVTEWLTRRTRAAAGPAAPDDSAEAVARRAKAKEKTAQARENAVRAGVAGLTDWLGDVAGAGLAGLPARDAAWWHSIQARMVDAQAKGLASAVDEVRGIVAAGGPHWAHDAADRLGGLHLLARLSSSPDAVVRRRLGFAVAEEEVRAGPGWSDLWVPLLKLESDDGLVRTVRQWAWGRSHGWVVAVRHLGGGGRPAPPFTHGVQVQGVVHPYPGVPPHRVAVGELLVQQHPAPVPAPATWRAALAGLEEHLKADPWQRLHPLACAAVRVTEDNRHLVDHTGHGLPVRADLALDQALALTGGDPFDAWALWNGRDLRVGAVAIPGEAPEVVG
ncbi:SWIM zinc finger domain-containing protein [Saccharothrix sp. S26]|uniref:SWIM zinc finger family protein n=1 Tax=Saccharothrix sp. S26 TaxID=2907215 RepID=UPI001F3D0932|nr:SWIM zinc finger family protein [Saccharothrix sp. S26]MCE6996958.1 SWIM zinc finger domain-containing protein [Saccharothrix sp. S26]